MKNRLAWRSNQIAVHRMRNKGLYVENARVMYYAALNAPIAPFRNCPALAPQPPPPVGRGHVMSNGECFLLSSAEYQFTPKNHEHCIDQVQSAPSRGLEMMQ